MTNIFWFHEDPRIAARMHADKHVPKMAIEAAQCVATALRRNGYDGSDIYDAYPSPGEQQTPQGWCALSRTHAEAALDYATAILAERNRRWPDREPHATSEELRTQRTLLDHPDVEWRYTDWVSNPPTFGIPPEWDNYGYISSYRVYAVKEKGYADASFTATDRPDWVEDIDQTLPDDVTTDS